MTVKEFTYFRLALNGYLRGDLPRLLGYQNSSKALRRFDQFCAELVDCDVLNRLRNSDIFASNEFEAVLTAERKTLSRYRAEQQKVAEMREKVTFVPHLWFLHENNIPSPIFVVGIFGLDTFKRIALPKTLTTQSSKQQEMILVRQFIEDFLANPPKDQHVLFNSFGKAKQILYRDLYEHSYVYDIEVCNWIGELEGVPYRGKVSLILGRIDITGIWSSCTERQDDLS